MDHKTAQQTLRDYAEGRIDHANAGSCPDSIEGPAVRDSDCPVCQALDAFAGAVPASLEPGALLPRLRSAYDACIVSMRAAGSDTDARQRQLLISQALSDSISAEQARLSAGAAPAAVASALDVTLAEDQAGLLRDMLGDREAYAEAIPVRLLVGDGHSGHGLYVAQAEYQDEGAVLLTALPAPAAPALEAPAAHASDERQALDLLALLFDAWELGTPCYEDVDEGAGFLGHAFQLDGVTFRACADLLNRRRPVHTRKEPKTLAAAPQAQAHEAPAAPALPASVREALEFYAENNTVTVHGLDAAPYSDSGDWQFTGYAKDGEENYAVSTKRAQCALADLAAAAPQAPAAPSIPQWIDDPHDIEQGRMLNPAWTQAQADGVAPVAEIMSKGYNGQVLWKGKVPPMGTLLYAAPQAAPAAPAVDANDTARIDWLQTKAVSVREPMRDGPREIFWAGPVDRAGISAEPSDLRARIDAAQAAAKGA